MTTFEQRSMLKITTVSATALTATTSGVFANLLSCSCCSLITRKTSAMHLRYTFFGGVLCTPTVASQGLPAMSWTIENHDWNLVGTSELDNFRVGSVIEVK